MDDLRNLPYVFGLEDEKEAVAHYKEYGYVVFRDVLTAAEVRETVEEVGRLCGADVGDPSTYGNFTGNRYGVVGKEPLVSPFLNRNRIHPNTVRAYQLLYGDRPILPCFDRAAWMRPTDLSMAWDTPFSSPGLHLDVSPRAYFDPAEQAGVDAFLGGLTYARLGDFVRENNAKCAAHGEQIQGVLNLVDNHEEDGGFHCVPGSHARLRDWYDAAAPRLPAAVPCGRYVFTPTYREDRVLCSYTQRVCAPAGSLILFSCTLAHGTRPNRSSHNRIIQFLRYIPQDTIPKSARRHRALAVDRILSSAQRP